MLCVEQSVSATITRAVSGLYTVPDYPVFLAATAARDRSPDHLRYPATRCAALANKARKARIRLRPGVVGTKGTVSTISATRNDTKRQDVRAFDGAAP